MIIMALAVSISFLGACSGDHPSHSGTDTVKNTYGVKKDTSKMDTSKKTGIDNSGTGGTDLVKDTSRHGK